MTLSTQEGKQPKGFAYTGMVFCSISICAAFSVMLHIVHAVRARQTHGARRPVGAILLLVGWMSLADMFWAAKFLWSYSRCQFQSRSSCGMVENCVWSYPLCQFQ